MSITNTVTDRYRTATDRFLERNWTEGAGVIMLTACGVALWFLYLLVFALEPDTSGDITSLTIGANSIVDAVLLSLFVGIAIAPFIVAYCWLVGPRLPIRRGYADVLALWTLVCPIAVGLALWYIRPDHGFLFHYTVPEIASNIGAYVLVTTLFALFAGGMYALANGSLRPSRRQRRALFAIGVVLVVVPLAVGAAYPADDPDDGFDRDAYVDGDPDDLESTTEPIDDGNEDEADDDQDDRTESDGDSDDGTESDTGDRTEIHEATLDELTCEATADLPDGPETDYAVAGTESLAESEIDVQYADFDYVDDGEVTDRAYAIPFDEEIVGVETAAESNSTAISVIYGNGVEVSTEMGAETRVWIDTINRDGKVVRHQFDLCPSVEDS